MPCVANSNDPGQEATALKWGPPTKVIGLSPSVSYLGLAKCKTYTFELAQIFNLKIAKVYRTKLPPARSSLSENLVLLVLFLCIKWSTTWTFLKSKLNLVLSTIFYRWWAIPKFRQTWLFTTSFLPLLLSIFTSCYSKWIWKSWKGNELQTAQPTITSQISDFFHKKIASHWRTLLERLWRRHSSKL